MAKTTFSIVIPTRNRARWIKATVQWMLQIDYPDFEVVVIDNDDIGCPKGSTSEALSDLHDSRLRIVRTGGLSMAENYEFALDAVQMEYTLLMGDKFLLHKDSLTKIDQCIQRERAKVISFRYLHLPPEETSNKRLMPFESEKLVDMILQGNMRKFTRFAPLCEKQACVSTAVLRLFKKKYGAFFLSPSAPDFGFAFNLLLFMPASTHINEKICALRAGMPSLGNSVRFGGGPLMKNEIKAVKNQEYDSLSHVPIKILSSNNVLYSLFFQTAEIMNKGYSHQDMDQVNYAISLFEDVLYTKKRFHVDVTNMLLPIYNFLEEHDLFYDDRVQTTLNFNCEELHYTL